MQKSFASAHLNGRRGEYRQEKGRSVLRPEFAALRRQWMLLPEFVAACCIYATGLLYHCTGKNAAEYLHVLCYKGKITLNRKYTNLPNSPKGVSVG